MPGERELLVYQTVTGRVVTSLPYSDLSWSRPLGTDGQCAAAIPLPAYEISDPHDPDTVKAGPIDVRGLTTPWRYSLGVVSEPRMLWLGPITARAYSEDGQQPSVKLAAAELWSILARRHLIGNHRSVGPGVPPTDWTVTGPSLAALCVEIVRYVLSIPGGFLPVILPEKQAGTEHTRTYKGSDWTDAATALEDIMKDEDGPDIRFDGLLQPDRRFVSWRMRVG